MGESSNVVRKGGRVVEVSGPIASVVLLAFLFLWIGGAGTIVMLQIFTVLDWMDLARDALMYSIVPVIGYFVIAEVARRRTPIGWSVFLAGVILVEALAIPLCIGVALILVNCVADSSALTVHETSVFDLRRSEWKPSSATSAARREPQRRRKSFNVYMESWREGRVEEKLKVDQQTFSRLSWLMQNAESRRVPFYVSTRPGRLGYEWLVDYDTKSPHAPVAQPPSPAVPARTAAPAVPKIEKPAAVEEVPAEPPKPKVLPDNFDVPMEMDMGWLGLGANRVSVQRHGEDLVLRVAQMVVFREGPNSNPPAEFRGLGAEVRRLESGGVLSSRWCGWTEAPAGMVSAESGAWSSTDIGLTVPGAGACGQHPCWTRLFTMVTSPERLYRFSGPAEFQAAAGDGKDRPAESAACPEDVFAAPAASPPRPSS